MLDWKQRRTLPAAQKADEVGASNEAYKLKLDENETLCAGAAKQ